MSNSYGHVNCQQSVWDKASNVRGKDPSLYKRDPYGNQIYRYSYGKDTAQGWNIDHIKPQSLGGSHNIRNLQAMQTSKNKSLQNTTNKKSRHR